MKVEIRKKLKNLLLSVFATCILGGGIFDKLF